MAKTKYTLIDSDDQICGFVVVNAPTLEHTQPILPTIDGPLADVVLFAALLTGFTLVPWVFGSPGWLAALVGVSMTGTLAAIKARYGTIIPPTLPTPPGVHLTGEFTATEYSTIHLDEIQRDDLSMAMLTTMCRAIAENGFVWVGRPTAKQYNVTRTPHEIIREEFSRLNYLGPGPEGKELITGRGRLFVRKIIELGKK